MTLKWSVLVAEKSVDDRKWSCQLEHWDILASLVPSSHWSTSLFWPLWDLKVRSRVQHCPNFQRKTLEQTFLKFLSLHLIPFLEFGCRNSGEIWMKTFNWNVIKISNKLTNTSRRHVSFLKIKLTDFLGIFLFLLTFIFICRLRDKDRKWNEFCWLKFNFQTSFDFWNT